MRLVKTLAINTNKYAGLHKAAEGAHKWVDATVSEPLRCVATTVHGLVRAPSHQNSLCTLHAASTTSLLASGS